MRRATFVASLVVLVAFSTAGTAPAQVGDRVFERVTPRGTEIVHERIGQERAASGTIGLVPPAGSADTTPGLVWHYANPSGQAWISAAVAVGQRGTQVMVGEDLNYQRAQLFSVFDVDPPTPIWEDASLDAPQSVYQVDSAHTGDYHVVLYGSDISTSGFTHAVNMYRSGSAVPIWTWTSPFTDTGVVKVAIDRSPGVVAIGAVETGAMLLHLYFLDPDTGTQLAHYSQSTPAGLRGFDLSADGSTLYFHDGATDCYIFDIASQTVIYSANIGASLDGHAISGDGTKFAFGKFYAIRIYEYDGTSWQRYSFSLGAGRYGDEMDFSDDGSTLGFTATQYSPDYGKTEIYMMDVATKTVTAYVENLSNGVKQDVCTSAAISHDGRYFAVGRWGDAQNANPEVQILENGVGLVGSIDTRGSVYDVDISWDGQVTVAGGKAIHANDFGNGGDVYVYDLGGEDMDLVGSPIAGQSVTLDLYTDPGWTYIHLIGTADDPNGWLVLPYGTLYLDLTPPNAFFLLPALIADASGLGSVTGSIPADPALVGATFFLQAVSFPADLSSLQLSRDYITMTVLP